MRRSVAPPGLWLGVFLLALAAAVAGCGQSAPPTPPGIAAVVEAGAGGPVSVRWTGMAVAAPPTPLGRTAGLWPPWQMAAVFDGRLWVALGSRVARLRPGGRADVVRSPGGAALLLYAAASRLWLVTDRSGRPAVLWTWFGHGFHRCAVLPAGLPRFVGAGGHPWILLIRPRQTLLWWMGRRVAIDVAAPESVGVQGRDVWLPMAVGSRPGVAVARGGRVRHRFLPPASVAVLAVGGAPPWLLTSAGLVPIRGARPRWRSVRPWPWPPPAGLSLVDAGSWLLVRTGAGAGWWFNPRAGLFRGSVHLTLPAHTTVLDLVAWPQ